MPEAWQEWNRASRASDYLVCTSFVAKYCRKTALGVALVLWIPKMTALLVLWFCGVCVVGIFGVYYSLPPDGARPNLYEVTLWILAGTVLAVSAVILMVSLFSPLVIQPAWWLP